ncbi:MAG: hypothetical protein IPQ04_13020 [Saprospiraceae bacterium]|nr:hypothetical protein [Saprospiraceae bacterium]
MTTIFNFPFFGLFPFSLSAQSSEIAKFRTSSDCIQDITFIPFSDQLVIHQWLITLPDGTILESTAYLPQFTLLKLDGIQLDIILLFQMVPRDIISLKNFFEMNVLLVYVNFLLAHQLLNLLGRPKLILLIPPFGLKRKLNSQCLGLCLAQPSMSMGN